MTNCTPSTACRNSGVAAGPACRNSGVATGPACRNLGAALAQGTVALHAGRRVPPRGGRCRAVAHQTPWRTTRWRVRAARQGRPAGDEPGTCPALSDRYDHASTNVCSNQDGFPSGPYVCSNNLHVSGKLWPLASIRCYLCVPSERSQRPFRNGRPPGDLPQPWRRPGGASPPRRTDAAPRCRSGPTPERSNAAACARRPGSPVGSGGRGRRQSATTKIVTSAAEEAPGTSRW